MKINRILKTTLAILIISTSALSAVSLEEATDKAVQYKKPEESINLKPKHKVKVGETEYWPLEITKLGEIQFIIPINTETGEVASNTTQKPIMKTHYLANFFKTTNSIKNYLDSAQSFGEDRESTFSSAKGELEFYEPQLNTTLSHMDPLQSTLGEAIDAAKTLQSDSIETSSQIDKINTPNDISKAENGIKEVISQQRTLINLGEEANTEAGELDQEIAAARDEGKIENSLATSLLSVTSNINTDYIQIRNSLKENENTLNDFLNSLDPKIDEFQSKLNERLSIPEEEKERNQIIDQLNDYSTQLNNVTNQTQDIPQSYLENQGFQTLSQETSDLITEAQDKCSEDKNISTCKEARNSYSDIEGKIEEMKTIVEGYSPCTEGTTKECTVNGKPGIKKCVNGQWTDCQPQETGGVNWMLVGGLATILIALIAYKFKDRFTGGGETEEKQESDMEEMWGQDNF